MNKVHCEITGQACSLSDTVVLTKINGIIFLKNIKVPEVYLNEKIIVSNSESSIGYYCELDVPLILQSLLGRVFAIVEDEDEVEQTTAILSAEGRSTHMTNQLLRFVEGASQDQVLRFPDTMFLTIVDSVKKVSLEICTSWKVPYNSTGKKYRYKNILQEKKSTQRFGYPGFLEPGFEVAVGDCSAKNLQGTGYMFKIENNFQNVDLCSNESAVDFCKEQNCLIFYSDFLNQGHLRILFYNTEDVNFKLQNNYSFRSSNF